MSTSFSSPTMFRDQARGQLGRNSCPRGRIFALNGTQGEVGVSLKKKKKFFFFFRETHFHSVTTQMQAVVTLSDNLHCMVFLLPLNGNIMCNGLFASKLTENALILCYNFSLSDCHFSLNSGREKSLLPKILGQLGP